MVELKPCFLASASCIQFQKTKIRWNPARGAKFQSVTAPAVKPVNSFPELILQYTHIDRAATYTKPSRCIRQRSNPPSAFNPMRLMSNKQNKRQQQQQQQQNNPFPYFLFFFFFLPILKSCQLCRFTQNDKKCSLINRRREKMKMVSFNAIFLSLSFLFPSYITTKALADNKWKNPVHSIQRSRWRPAVPASSQHSKNGNKKKKTKKKKKKRREMTANSSNETPSATSARKECKRVWQLSSNPSIKPQSSLNQNQFNQAVEVMEPLSECKQ